MIDTKRLAEQMQPGSLQILAGLLDSMRNTWADPSRASKHDIVPVLCMDALGDAAAVLREVARRGEASPKLKSADELTEELAKQIDATMPRPRGSDEWRAAFNARLHEHHMGAVRDIDARLDVLEKDAAKHGS